MTKTLGAIFGELSAKERAYICLNLNSASYKGVEWHQGMLPMVSIHDLVRLMAEGSGRFHRTLVEKLRQYVSTNGFIMYLDSKKVIRRFGSRPELGCKLAGHAKEATAGIKWHQFAGDFKANPIMVQPCFSLKCINKGKWMVYAEPQYRKAVEEYLLNNCV